MGSLSNYIDELHVAEVVYPGENVVSGWFEHFKGLSAALHQMTLHLTKATIL